MYLVNLYTKRLKSLSTGLYDHLAIRLTDVYKSSLEVEQSSNVLKGCDKN